MKTLFKTKIGNDTLAVKRRKCTNLDINFGGGLKITNAIYLNNFCVGHIFSANIDERKIMDLNPADLSDTKFFLSLIVTGNSNIKGRGKKTGKIYNTGYRNLLVNIPVTGFDNTINYLVQNFKELDTEHKLARELIIIIP